MTQAWPSALQAKYALLKTKPQPLIVKALPMVLTQKAASTPISKAREYTGSMMNMLPRP